MANNNSNPFEIDFDSYITKLDRAEQKMKTNELKNRYCHIKYNEKVSMPVRNFLNKVKTFF